MKTTSITKGLAVQLAVLLLPLLSGVVFFLPNTSRASTVYSQGTGGEIYSNSYAAATLNFSGLTSTEIVDSLTFNVKQSEMWDSSCHVEQGYRVILDSGGANEQVILHAFLPSTDWQMVTLDISSFGISADHLGLVVLNSDTIGCEGYPYLGTKLLVSGVTDSGALVKMYYSSDFAPYLILSNSSTGVFFKNPPAVSGAAFSDFNIWSLCVRFPGSDSHTQFSLSLAVWAVGESVPTPTDLGTFNKPVGAYSSCLDLPKSGALAVGAYNARVYLYDSTDLLLDSSGWFFQIVSGTATQYPTSINRPLLGDCEQDNIFIRGICGLFVPDQKYIDDIVAEKDVIMTKFPLAYVQDFSDAVTSIDPTDENVPAITFNLAASALPMSVDVFNEDKITELAGETNMTLFRGLMSGALWVAFGFAVFYSIKELH